ncbi:hypothetical protein RN629_09615 [Sphingomonadaceae bacterium jetA1]|jgi:hypothetical protein|uniref:hypothetical protein n=1 Tax=Facivitalis istanbulensis TaxID=3075838 RepID=UPI00347394B1
MLAWLRTRGRQELAMAGQAQGAEARYSHMEMLHLLTDRCAAQRDASCSLCQGCDLNLMCRGPGLSLPVDALRVAA